MIKGQMWTESFFFFFFLGWYNWIFHPTELKLKLKIFERSFVQYFLIVAYLSEIQKSSTILF